MQDSTLPDVVIQSERRSTLSLGELAPLVITIVAGLVCYGIFFNRGLWLSVVSYSISPAERLLDGEVPYRDFFFNYTPGVLWLNAMLMKLFGVTLMPVRVGLFAFKVATLVALFYAGRRFVGSRAALAAVALTLAWLGHKYVIHVHPTQYIVLFTLAGTIFALNYEESDKGYWLALCGAAIGLAFLFKYNVGILLLASATAVVAIRELVAGAGPGRIFSAATRIILLWAGFGVAAAALVAYLALNGALGAAIEHFLHHATEYSEERSIGLPGPKLLVPGLAALAVVITGGWIMVRRWPRFFQAYAIIVLALGCLALLIPGRLDLLKQSVTALVAYLPPALFLWTFGVALFRLRQSYASNEGRRRWWREEGPTVTVSLFALGLYLEVFPRADYYHLVRVLPPVFLLLVIVIARHLPGPNRAAITVATVAVGLLLVAGVKDTWQPQFDSRFAFTDRVPLTIERARGILVSQKQSEEIESLVRLIHDNSNQDDFIFSPSRRGSAYHFLAARKNPTPILWWDSVGISTEDREAVLEMITERKPRLVLAQESLADARLWQVVRENYHEIGAVGDIAVYDRNQ